MNTFFMCASDDEDEDLDLPLLSEDEEEQTASREDSLSTPAVACQDLTDKPSKNQDVIKDLSHLLPAPDDHRFQRGVEAR
ncbi:hypothetical protein RRG08_018430 [Elysia crispata]|uniref:Uncharacterized protein n=1 Tax=Elysia crispata TaxID=231223 RepID=A0AAE1B9L7_9GAST|nr:hypothetical protein RRG08_018430 [Elysia crispata]